MSTEEEEDDEEAIEERARVEGDIDKVIPTIAFSYIFTKK